MTKEEREVEEAEREAYQAKRSRERLVKAWLKECHHLRGAFKVNWLFMDRYRLNIYKSVKDKTIVASYFIVVTGVEGEGDLEMEYSSPAFPKSLKGAA